MATDYTKQVEGFKTIVRTLQSGVAVSLDEVCANVCDVDPDSENLVDRLIDCELIRLDRRSNAVSLTGLGKAMSAQRCVPEFVLGPSYWRWRYDQAVVRVIVPGADGESAGSGFFVDDPPNCVVTNRHVVADGKVISILDKTGRQICDHTAPVEFGPANLDLAIVRCETPSNILPLRIDWETDGVNALDEVLVLGYPYIPMHQPELFAATGQVGMYASQLASGKRKSLILTRIAAPGCSGGPVIGPKGMVIGVVESEAQLKTADGILPSMLCALPAHYLRELLSDDISVMPI